MIDVQDIAIVWGVSAVSTAEVVSLEDEEAFLSPGCVDGFFRLVMGLDDFFVISPIVEPTCAGTEHFIEDSCEILSAPTAMVNPFWCPVCMFSLFHDWGGRDKRPRVFLCG